MLFCLALLITVQAAEKTYVVKKDDTLYGIARKNGLTVARLAERNGISKNLHVLVGQRLVIPPAPAKGKPATPALAASVQQAITSAAVKPGRWKYVVIHHSGASEGTLKGIDRYHREERHMENGLAYHFLIGNGHGMADGEIGVGNRWKKQLDGGHLRSLSQNKVALGICLVGNFDQTRPTQKQLTSLEDLTRALMERCNLPISAIKTHQQINVVPTECPGSKFPTKTILANLKKPAA